MEFRFKNQNVQQQEVVFDEEKEKEVSSSKFLAKVFGYMFIGLAITAVVALVWALVVAKVWPGDNGALSEEGATIAAATGIICLIGCLIISIVNSIFSIATGKAPWIGFILYAICIGGAFSLILLAGVSLGVIAEAFGITALAFGSMFLVGFFSKKNLNWLTLVAVGLGVSVLLTSLFWGIFYLVSPKSAILLDYLISLGVIAIAMIFVAIDTYNMKRIAQKGQANNNLALFCAFNMYSDFLLIFIRVLYLILKAKNN